MTIKEIEQLIKDIPEELYEIPQYGKLIHTTSITKEVGTFFEDGAHYVTLNITTGTVPIAQFNIYEDMIFTYVVYIENCRSRLINYLKVQIPYVLNQIRSYLNILGFKEFKYGR